MRIEFYDVDTGEVLDRPYNTFFVMGNGEVWADNGNYWESQSASIGFEDCIRPCPNIGWRVVK